MGRTSDARDRLIQAAIDLIWQQSYGAVSVDAICERAQVKKGSFYHFFESKNELVVEALEAHWQSRKPVLDALFSPTEPPLVRLKNYFDHVYERQAGFKAETGRVLGCMYSAIGSECCEKQPDISAKVRETLAIYTRYYESALRDAKAQGLIDVADPAAAAQDLFAFMEGVLSQARIRNDPELVRNLAASAFAFLGIETPGKVAA